MKKKYVAPEFDKIMFDIADIITLSVATGHESGYDNVVDWSEGDLDGLTADGTTLTWNGWTIGG